MSSVSICYRCYHMCGGINENFLFDSSFLFLTNSFWNTCTLMKEEIKKNVPPKGLNLRRYFSSQPSVLTQWELRNNIRKNKTVEVRMKAYTLSHIYERDEPMFDYPYSIDAVVHNSIFGILQSIHLRIND